MSKLGNGARMRIRDNGSEQLSQSIHTFSLESIVQSKLDQVMEPMNCDNTSCLYEQVLCSVERPLIKLVLGKTNGNQCKAAKMLGINRNTLRKKINLLDINVK